MGGLRTINVTVNLQNKRWNKTIYIIENSCSLIVPLWYDQVMRTAIYARVSTSDRQDTDNQLHQLRDYCARQGWTIAGEYIDHATGKNSSREGLRNIFNDASRRSFDVVLVWALDRFTREGVLETFEHIRKLSNYGVQFHSFTEPQFRTDGPTGELMLAIAAWIAKQERLRISDRTKAGLARVRREGKTLGRPRVVLDRHHIDTMKASGMSLGAIAKALNASKTTIARLVARR